MITAAIALSLFATPPALPAQQLAVIVVAVDAPVEDATPTLEDAPGLLKTMIDAFKEGNIPLAIGALALLLALLVGAINAFLLKMTSVIDETRKKVLPWLVAAGGCLTAFGLALIAGVGWLPAILAGLVTSAAATGLWELVIKTILRAVNKTEPPPAKS